MTEAPFQPRPYVLIKGNATTSIDVFGYFRTPWHRLRVSLGLGLKEGDGAIVMHAHIAEVVAKLRYYRGWWL